MHWHKDTQLIYMEIKYLNPLEVSLKAITGLLAMSKTIRI